MSCSHASDKAEAAAPEATEAATAAPTPIAGTPTHAFDKSSFAKRLKLSIFAGFPRS